MSGPTGAAAGAEGSAAPGGAAARTRGGAAGRREGRGGTGTARRERAGRTRSPGFAGELWPRRDGGRADLGTGCAAAASAAVLGLVVVYVLRWWLLATLVSAVVALGVAAAVVGGSVLTGLYFRRTHEVMFGGGRPEDPPPGEGEDPAHRAYHGGPAWWDLRTIVGRTWTASALWGVLLGAHFAVHALVVAAYLAAAWTLVGVLRVVDAGVLAVRRVRMVCPGCFLRLGYPAYLCTRCGRRHDAIRPGLRGLLRRRCLCGARLPTLLLLGSADLDALCPHCDRGLDHRPGEAREFVLPVFGSAGAGKTRLVAGMNLALAQAARGTREAYAEPVGEETVRRLRDGERLLAAAHRTGPTPPGREVRGLTVRVGAEGRTLLLQVYDAAGERFSRSATTEELAYLGQASTFVLVVDPLGVEAVWRSMTAGERSRLSGNRSRARDPELAYGAVRDEIRRQYRMTGRRLRSRRARTRRARTRLAVVVSRGDLVHGTSAAPGGMPPEEWAARILGLGNLLRDAEADFGEVRVFLASSVADGSGIAHPSLSALLRWVLAGESAAFAGMLAGPAPGSGAGAAPRGAPVPLGPAPPRPERVGGSR
ncbi:hypothetical protein ACIRPH_04820 [Nocardiopsis sp. NPDC101807]|uniref:TRAFAC clade GTPase domain-containing protein n=1 Tax=Nocardiopsis sp. NPDC101807 TaxID=3364339 RepID=UPI00381674F8